MRLIPFASAQNWYHNAGHVEGCVQVRTVTNTISKCLQGAKGMKRIGHVYSIYYFVSLYHLTKELKSLYKNISDSYHVTASQIRPASLLECKTPYAEGIHCLLDFVRCMKTCHS
jgi:hypothetical protein